MPYNNFTEQAILTESRIDEVKTSTEALKHTIAILIAAGNMLDMIKKNVFYGKKIDNKTWLGLVSDVEHHSDLVDSPYIEDPAPVAIDPRIFHAIVGITTESIELLEAMTSAINNNGSLDAVNVLEETGDICWYQAILMDALQANMENVQDTVIAKLRARYPNKFTQYDATNRDLTAERSILETVERSTE